MTTSYTTTCSKQWTSYFKRERNSTKNEPWSGRARGSTNDLQFYLNHCMENTNIFPILFEKVLCHFYPFCLMKPFHESQAGETGKPRRP